MGLNRSDSQWPCLASEHVGEAFRIRQASPHVELWALGLYGARRALEEEEMGEVLVSFPRKEPRPD